MNTSRFAMSLHGPALAQSIHDRSHATNSGNCLAHPARHCRHDSDMVYTRHLAFVSFVSGLDSTTGIHRVDPRWSSSGNSGGGRPPCRPASMLSPQHPAAVHSLHYTWSLDCHSSYGMLQTISRASSLSSSTPWSFAAAAYHFARQFRQKPARFIMSIFCTSVRSLKCSTIRRKGDEGSARHNSVEQPCTNSPQPQVREQHATVGHAPRSTTHRSQRDMGSKPRGHMPRNQRSGQARRAAAPLTNANRVPADPQQPEARERRHRATTRVGAASVRWTRESCEQMRRSLSS